MTVTEASLKRSGVEPARVFGRVPFPAQHAQLLRAETESHGEWWAPGFPQWALQASIATCPVLAKAAERYGFREAPKLAELVERLILRGDYRDESSGGLDWQPFERTADDGPSFPAYRVASGAASLVVVAAPVVYVERRYGADSVEWGLTHGLLTAWVEGMCVGLYRGYTPSGRMPGES